MQMAHYLFPYNNSKYKYINNITYKCQHTHAINTEWMTDDGHIQKQTTRHDKKD